MFILGLWHMQILLLNFVKNCITIPTWILNCISNRKCSPPNDKKMKSIAFAVKPQALLIFTPPLFLCWWRKIHM
ncbi:hypothetical protein XELAEV_18031878mg [Xenopus laevis]|uniref:Uncharacterized protein n=1 Tax=Xenopus laevis TaxID=8355 RepID=A0A974CPL4_XENLA|nr:hypothetical protein XELAEV_18031878mg [Xenopus laevis]